MNKEKNIYVEARKQSNLTQAKASEAMQTISEDRLARLETAKITMTPNDVLEMANAYKRPDLCNYYCTHECPIGKNTLSEIKPQQLSNIILKMVASLNTIETEKNALIEITSDGQISENELKDFARIQMKLNEISSTVEALKLWVKEMIANGSIDEKEYEKVLQELTKSM
mgnify:CR=1 FL=1